MSLFLSRKKIPAKVWKTDEVKSFALDASFNEIVKFSLQSCSELKVGADVVNKEEEEARMRQKELKRRDGDHKIVSQKL